MRVRLTAAFALLSAAGAATVAMAIEAPALAVAEGWPQPAAGESKTGDIEILFTFDDGPSALYTAPVLDVLAKNHVHAVFFLVGNMVANRDKRVPRLLAREQAEGHVLANHSMNHKNECRGTDEAADADIDDGKKTIEAATGWPMVWLRIPGGARCARVDAMLAKRGLTHFHWDLDPQEWRFHSADKAFDYVTGELTRAHGRVVLLMHDIQPVTAETITRVLAWIDEENARRSKSHKRKIRIMQAPELAIERMPTGLADWILDASAGARALPSTLARVLP